MAGLPTLPAQGGTAWYSWAAGVHASALTGSINVVAAGAVGDGVTDDTAVVQSIFTSATAGQGIYFPPGYVFRITSPLTVPNRAFIHGGGELRFTAGLDFAGVSAGLWIKGSGTKIRDITLTNPNLLRPDNTFGNGYVNYGIYIEASGVTVSGCTVDSFQTGIAVAMTGEWTHFSIIGNRIKDVLGAGGGSSDSTTQNGEDKGDGICCWGAMATISGNVINCKAGYDARIGIHTEGLPDQAGLVVPTPAHADSMVTITGNVVTGQFRRSLVTEKVTNVVISNNVVADGTWWGVAIANTANTVVSGNSITHNRTSADNQGSATGPRRSAINIIGSTDCTIIGNQIQATAAAVIDSYINIEPGGSPVASADNVQIISNHCWASAGAQVTYGVHTNTTTGRLVIKNNQFQGYTTTGLFLFSGGPYQLDGNLIDGTGGGAARTVTNGVTNATTTVTSATAAFSSADVGATITGGSIPAGAYIQSVTNTTTVVISAAASASASGVTLTITRIASGHGIEAGSSLGGSVSGNLVYSTAVGLYLANNSALLVADNRVTRCPTALEGFGATYTVVTGNIWQTTTTTLSNISNGTNNNTILNNVTAP